MLLGVSCFPGVSVKRFVRCLAVLSSGLAWLVSALALPCTAPVLAGKAAIPALSDRECCSIFFTFAFS